MNDMFKVVADCISNCRLLTKYYLLLTCRKTPINQSIDFRRTIECGSSPGVLNVRNVFVLLAVHWDLLVVWYHVEYRKTLFCDAVTCTQKSGSYLYPWHEPSTNPKLRLHICTVQHFMVIIMVFSILLSILILLSNVKYISIVTNVWRYRRANYYSN